MNSRDHRRRFHPADLLAGLIVLGSFGLMLMKVDGVVHAVLITVVAYYFGQVATRRNGVAPKDD